MLRGLGCRVWGLVFTACGLGVSALSLHFGVQDPGDRFWFYSLRL